MRFVLLIFKQCFTSVPRPFTLIFFYLSCSDLETCNDLCTVQQHAHGTKGSSRSDPFHAPYLLPWASQVALVVENPPTNAGVVRDPGSIPGSGRYPEEGMATCSSILVWRIQWTEEAGGLQSMGLWSRTWLRQLSTQQAPLPLPIYLTCHMWGLLTHVSAPGRPLSSYLQVPFTLLFATWIPHIMTFCKEILFQGGFQDDHHPVTLCRADYRTSTAEPKVTAVGPLEE